MSPQNVFDPFGTRRPLVGDLSFYSLRELERRGTLRGADALPRTVLVLLEAVLRRCNGFEVGPGDVEALCGWSPAGGMKGDVPFIPARVVLQDFTGVPVLVDIAAMRSAVARLGGDPKRINPLVPVDLVVDHSVQVDAFGKPGALLHNLRTEFTRNGERYRFLRWGQSAVHGFRVVPPGTGIVHQVNLEYLAAVVLRGRDDRGPVAYPDTLVGTDSHTTMINGLAVLGWGVGGIEAEAAMLGQPLYLPPPRVTGVRVHGEPAEGVTATDIVLAATQMLRKAGVVDQFVEFCGEGLDAMSLPDRATIANMAPEYGATTGYFPPDAETLSYLRRTGRPAELVDLVERYAKDQGLFREKGAKEPVFERLLDLDLSKVEPAVAGPGRPQDRIALSGVKAAFRKALSAPPAERGFGLKGDEIARKAPVQGDGAIGHGAVVIAAITSCTNTSNPSVMLGAGLLAKKAVERGLRVPAHVKTSLAPGSLVVTEYLAEAGLVQALEALGFHTVGYGCTTCIGNSGPLPEAVGRAVEQGGLVAASVLSGNRNFEGRIHPLVRANYLASPPLVVAYALAGTVDIDFEKEPLGTGADGKPVFLREIWPSGSEIVDTIAKSVRPQMFERVYADVFKGSGEWRAITGATGDLYQFEDASTYIQEPPFFEGFGPDPAPLRPIQGARVLALLGDSVTTDHISPAGDIAEDSPAGRWLVERGVKKADFNSYGSRRGNDRIMVRGTFANIRLRNKLVPGVEGGWTAHQPSGEKLTIFDAAERYRAEGVPLVVIAGKDYGMGSSRDWAAKGTMMLGVRAVLAESFERIHRSNLVGMGVLPLVFEPGHSAAAFGLDGTETISIDGIGDDIQPRAKVVVRARKSDGRTVDIPAIARLDTPVDVLYYRNGGILQTVLRQLLKG